MAAQMVSTSAAAPAPGTTNATAGGGTANPSSTLTVPITTDMQTLTTTNTTNLALTETSSTSAATTTFGTLATTTTTPASTTTATTTTTRLENTTAFLPIVYGSVAFYLGKKADEFQTHEWTLYVRGPNHEDLSCVISKVIFQLHASFAQPVREYTQPPFEVTERGWGEFEAQIRIVWKDTTEKPTVVNHGIKLYPPGAAPNALLLADNAEPVISEVYDEVVFTDPTESFYHQLIHISHAPKVESTQQQHFQNKVYNDQEDVLLLVEASKFLKEELTKAKQRYKIVSDELEGVDQALEEAQQQQKRQKQQHHQQSTLHSSSNKQQSTANPLKAPTEATTTSNHSTKKSKASATQRKPKPSNQTKKGKT